MIQRAREAGLIEIRVHDLRNWTHDRHRTVDDRPFGGGEGMLLKAGPIFEAVESIWPDAESKQRGGAVVGAGPEVRSGDWRGSSAELDELLLICGRYEGVDERVAEHLADDEISIGDYVLSGGELAAAVVIDAVARLQEGVLGNEKSAVAESFGRTACSIVRSIRGRRSFAAGRCRKCCIGGNHEADPAVEDEGGAGENRAAAARIC